MWIDTEGLHLNFDNIGNLNKSGIFYEQLLKKPHLNYYFFSMYGVVPKKNQNECIQTMIVSSESPFTINIFIYF